MPVRNCAAQAPTPDTSPYKVLIPRAFVTSVQFDRFLAFFQDIILGMEPDQMNEMAVKHQGKHSAKGGTSVLSASPPRRFILVMEHALG